MNRVRSLVVLPVLLVALAALACASMHAYYLAPDAPPASSLERVVVLPLNFDVTPSPQIAESTDYMLDKVIAHLEGTGIEVESLPLSVVVRYWKAASESEGGVASEEDGRLDLDRYEAARAAVARRVLEERSPDAVVIPTIVMRKGQYSSDSLVWDGVRRKVLIDTSQARAPRLTPRGIDYGTSLRIAIYDASGRKIFDRHAGLEPASRFIVVGKQWSHQPRIDLFRDEALLDEGVSIAFQPWLPPTDEAGS